MSLDWLLGYEAHNRTVAPELFYEGKKGLSSFDEFRAILNSSPFKQLGITESLLCEELAELLRQRCIAALMPHAAIFGAQSEVKPAIRAHLGPLGVASDENLVSALKHLSQNFRNRSFGYRKKLTINDVRVNYQSLFFSILECQKGRCKTCGVKLQFGENMQLDHILPWHLGDDPDNGRNWQFLCTACNRGKSEWLHYTSRFARVATLHAQIEDVLTESVMYATLERDRKCVTCGQLPENGELSVRRRLNSGCWVLDNTSSYCAKCAPSISPQAKQDPQS